MTDTRDEIDDQGMATLTTHLVDEVRNIGGHLNLTAAECTNALTRALVEYVLINARPGCGQSTIELTATGVLGHGAYAISQSMGEAEGEA